MYVDTCHYMQNGKRRTRILLRTSYREKGKVKHKTIANLTNCPPDEIEALRFALKHKQDLSRLQALVGSRWKMRKGLSVGAVLVLQALAKRLRIAEALGQSRQGDLALWQVMARIIDQGSRLSAVRLAGRHAVCDVLGLDAFDEDDLYENLDWLDEQQARIEDRLFRQKRREGLPQLFLYDVTSSYFEGQCNELAEFGHDRDGKRGKKQIVIGLLTDEEGDPVSAQVFRGNMSDAKTFGEQVWKVKERFGVELVTMVGDRGMIKRVQIEQLPKYFHYITAITKPQIEALLKKKVLQMCFFDEAVCEVEWNGLRYVLRRNPVRAEEVMATRKDKQAAIEKLVDEQNQYLASHPRAALSVALRRVRAKIQQLKAHKWLEVKEEGRHLVLAADEEKLNEVSRLDGCYVIKTDLVATETSAQTIHDRYKDLSEVEWAFRTMKTVHLEIRPHYVRKASRTRGHVFAVMLAYKIVRYLRDAWRELDITVEEGVRELTTICSTELEIGGTCCCQSIPEPNSPGKELLKALRVTLPDAIRRKGVTVATRKKLTPRR